MSLPWIKSCFSSTTSPTRYLHCWGNVVELLAGGRDKSAMGAINRAPTFLFYLCMSLVLASFLFPAQVSAHTRSTNNTSTGKPTLQVVAGFNDDESRLDYWSPVKIILSNDGPDFKGVLSATTYTSPSRSGSLINSILPWSYQQPITLPHHAQQQISMFVPFYESPSTPRGIIATLSTSNGKVIATQTDVPFTPRSGTLLIGILSDQTAQGPGFNPLSAVLLPDPTRPIEMVTLDHSTLPDMSEPLDNFDVIVLDDFTTSTLNTAQLSALQTWINQGGVLIEVGGPQWQRTLATLPPQLLPVVIHGTEILPAGTHLLPAGSPTIAETGQQPAPGILHKSITISTATLPEKGDARQEALSNLETVLASGSIPLIVQAHQGKGVICYLAFDPTTEPLIKWPGAIALWKGVLLHTLGDQSLIPGGALTYSNGPGQLFSRGGLLQILQPGTLLPVWEFLFLLLGYIILIGPVCFLIVKRLKRPAWSWRIVLSNIVVFSFLTYGLAYIQKEASINSISIIQLNQGGNFAHVTTFFSALIPDQGKSQVNIPARSLTQPIAKTLFLSDSRVSNSDERAAITVGQNETIVNLLHANGWSLYPIVSEEDQKVHGGLLSHPTLHNGTLSGTIANTLDTSLSDVYILMPHSFAYLGRFPAGQTQQVNVSLHSSPLNTGTTLANQIARNSHLPVPYFPYSSGSHPQDDFQRHLAILAALSGEGFSSGPCTGPCSTQAIVSKHLIITPPVGVPKVNSIGGSDPLLIAGAPATLIGWADQPVAATNNVTINGASPGGTHDDLIQIPLNVDFSGSLNLAPGLISAQVINAQGDEVQTILPNVYTMNTGSITFEFTLPNVGFFQTNSMTISEPAIAQLAGSGATSPVHTRLYNWHTSSWDAIVLNNTSFTTANTKAYTSPDGHILLQVVDQSASPGTILFAKPALSLNNAVN
jgi:hypothetical protein